MILLVEVLRKQFSQGPHDASESPAREVETLESPFGSHSRLPRLGGEQGDLAKEVPTLKPGHHCGANPFFAGNAANGSARLDQVKFVSNITLFDDDVTVCKRCLLETVGNREELVLCQETERLQDEVSVVRLIRCQHVRTV